MIFFKEHFYDIEMGKKEILKHDTKVTNHKRQ